MIKRIFSILLVITMLITTIPIAFAETILCDICSAEGGEYFDDCIICGNLICLNCGHCSSCAEHNQCTCKNCKPSQSTRVEYDAQADNNNDGQPDNVENYTLTVPALLRPGQKGNVTLTGQWASNRTITVTADSTVTLTNSIYALDKKVIDVYFDGISQAGNNTKPQTYIEEVSVGSVSNALFGTWRGTFYYNVDASTTFNPYEIRYYQPYQFNEGTPFEFVFHKDGTIDAYFTEDGFDQGNVIPNAYVLEDKTINIMGRIFDISEDGTQLHENGQLIAQLVPTPIHQLHFNSEYKNVLLFDDELFERVICFASNGSGQYKEYINNEENDVYDMPANTFTYYDEYFIETWIDDDGEEQVDRHAVYPDGSKIICYEVVYNLVCSHPQHYIANETENYTGDTFCSDCHKLISRGIYTTGESYALYCESDQSLTFTRANNEILPGDTYHGKEVTEVYTGFETDIYDVGESRSRVGAIIEVTTPWHPHANDIQFVQFDCIVKPIATRAWFYDFTNLTDIDLTNLDMSNTSNTAHMFANSGLTEIPDMNLTSTVEDMSYMFSNCYSLNHIGDFNIPRGTIIIDGIFKYCEMLQDCSTLIIPNTIEYMQYAFSYCTALQKAPTMNQAINVIDMAYAFLGCENLLVAPQIPSAESMSGTFENCVKLTTAPVLPNNLIYASNIFQECSELKTYHNSTEPDYSFKNYYIPENIEDARGLFYRCELITALPDFDHCLNLTDMSSAFRDCTSLIHPPKMPSNVNDLSMAFYGCEYMQAAPHLDHCANLKDLSSTFAYCRNITVAPILPQGVEDISSIFENTNIKTYEDNIDGLNNFANYPIPDSVTNMEEAFVNANFVVGPTVPSSVTNMKRAFYRCLNMQEITINANPEEYNDCLGVFTQTNYDMGVDLTLKGQSTMLLELAQTSAAGRRTIYDINGNILRQ